MDKISSALKKLGLTDGEIKVYLALIELDNSTVGPIIEKAGISSSKVYIIIEKLISKGIVTYIIKEKTKHFQAAKPNSLLEIVEKKETELSEIKEEIINTIKELDKKKHDKKEEAIIYKGYKGLKTGILELAKKTERNGKYYFLSHGYGKDPVLFQIFRELSQLLKEKNVRILGLANFSEKEMYNKMYKKLGYDMKYTHLIWPADTAFNNDTVQILVWKKEQPTLYVLKSNTLADSYIRFFNAAWNQT